MKIQYIGGEPDPNAVIDIGGQCQVQVKATATGTVLRFDGPNGEIEFRIKDDEWYALTDLVALARKNAGIFDSRKYCAGCFERNDFCRCGNSEKKKSQGNMVEAYDDDPRRG